MPRRLVTVIDVIEAAYRAARRIPETWAADVLAVATPLLDRGASVVAYGFNFVESAITGFDARDRTSVALTIGANDCGFAPTTVAETWIFDVVTRDSSGAPSYLAYWPGTATSTFPGYDYQSTGTKADPLRPCATAPTTPCEPACNLGAVPSGGCGLVAP